MKCHKIHNKITSQHLIKVNINKITSKLNKTFQKHYKSSLITKLKSIPVHFKSEITLVKYSMNTQNSSKVDFKPILSSKLKLDPNIQRELNPLYCWPKFIFPKDNLKKLSETYKQLIWY